MKIVLIERLFLKISKMNCFTSFKRKGKEKKQSNSAPELRNQNPSNASNNRVSKSANSASSSRSIPELYREKQHNLRVFTYNELREATNDFNKLLKVGEGGFGSVYKGTIKPINGKGDPIVVAIKKLNRYGMQGHKEFLAEVQFLGVVDHPKLVKLLGYCAVDGERGIQRLLVYEYMQNKSLEHHLFGKNFPALPWIRRLQIMLDAAEGLSYLHDGIEVQVIFRDFKSSNVLLDQHMNAKLSDFGMAREGPSGDATHVSTAPVGTFGYAAPEYVDTGHLKQKSDIYSFGVVLYEILTGRRAIERNRPASEQKLLDWVKQFPADSKMFSMMMDFRLRNQYPLSTARKIAKLADRCLVKTAEERPNMSEIIEVLKGAVLESEASSSRVNTPQTSKAK
ncbi:probable serine/threonine-protein kinase PBL19 [Chenopodium quinoa]|uniref:Protein kinase domain-containing protein n=1 Tax=Chenopodium quinoa TaxID=63459 RepID=A0A803LUB0_CHEQI|nr:probable serine/threonine-protein kinase PBL19 [Chenopodium quinoa]